MMRGVSTTDLLDRPVYGISQVDELLALKSGTARRWIDGYTRGGKAYPPVVRVERTESELVTWGEFVETRLLSEYRDKGVPLVRMRPAIDVLRERFGWRYPLAHAKPFVFGRELVMAAQEEVALDRALYLVVLRKGQLVLSDAAERFFWSTDFISPDGKYFVIPRDVDLGEGSSASYDYALRPPGANWSDAIVSRVRPLPTNRYVVIDPLRQFGQPVVRSVPTEVIAEQVRAGDRLEAIAEVYELSMEQVEAAIQYELTRAGSAVSDAA